MKNKNNKPVVYIDYKDIRKPFAECVKDLEKSIKDLYEAKEELEQVAKEKVEEAPKKAKWYKRFWKAVKSLF